MNDYLDCLFNYILETRLNKITRTSVEYQRASAEALHKSDALEAMLTSAQKAALDDFLAADSHMVTIDEHIIFQEALALGKWMAR